MNLEMTKRREQLVMVMRKCAEYENVHSLIVEEKKKKDGGRWILFGGTPDNEWSSERWPCLRTR